jgi:GNAT superfamily N-acetyltransferase
VDIDELIRLRGVMFDSLLTDDGDHRWKNVAAERLRTWLEGDFPEMVAYVVDRPEGGLAACAFGAIHTRLGRQGDPGGHHGYVYNVCTDADSRRRGYSRACMNALLEWFAGGGIKRVTLNASDEGRALYDSLGFEANPAAMSLHL